MTVLCCARRKKTSKPWVLNLSSLPRETVVMFQKIQILGNRMINLQVSFEKLKYPRHLLHPREAAILLCMHITQRKRSQGKTEFGMWFLDARSAETNPLKLASPNLSRIWFDTTTNTNVKKMVRCMWTSYSQYWKISNSARQGIHKPGFAQLPEIWKMRMEDWSFSCNPGTFRWNLCFTKIDEFRDDFLHMQRIHLSRGSSTRPVLYCRSWIGRRRKGTKRRRANNFLDSSWSFQQRFQRSRANYRFQQSKKSALSNSLETWTRYVLYWVHLRSAPNAGLEFWQTGSNAIITHRSVPIECVVKVVSESGKRDMFARQLTPPEEPKVTLWEKWVHRSSNALRLPRETEKKLQIWDSNPIPSESHLAEGGIWTLFWSSSRRHP